MLDLIVAAIRLLLRLLGARGAASGKAERLGAAEAHIQMEQHIEEAVQKASVARDAVAGVDARAPGLQHAIQSDPDCRDC